MKPYGCHNHPRRTSNDIVRHGNGEPHKRGWQWRFIETPQCHYDNKTTDQRCTQCRWVTED